MKLRRSEIRRALAQWRQLCRGPDQPPPEKLKPESPAGDNRAQEAEKKVSSSEADSSTEQREIPLEIAQQCGKWLTVWRYCHGYLSARGTREAFLAHPEWRRA